MVGMAMLGASPHFPYPSNHHNICCYAEATERGPTDGGDGGARCFPPSSLPTKSAVATESGPTDGGDGDARCFPPTFPALLIIEHLLLC
jgi:hypothetical protein